MAQLLGSPSGYSIQRKCACGGDCADCRAAAQGGMPPVQTRLAVSEPRDFHERQADSLASDVMRSSGPVRMPSFSAPSPAAQAPEAIYRRAEHTSQPASPAVTPDALGRGGEPLPQGVRGFFEPRFGRNFSGVRVHTGSFSDAVNRALHSLAFTFGQHIWLGRGQPLGATPLMAHELVHTLQQTSDKVHRQSESPKKEEDPLIPRSIKIPPGLSNVQELYRYAEIQIFGTVRNIAWEPSARAQTLLQNIGSHAGEKITFFVRASALARYGGGTTGAQTTTSDNQSYAALNPDDRDEINKEIDRRYYGSTGETPGTLIKKDEKGKVAIWNSFKGQVLADKRKLDALPVAVKTLLGGTSSFTPAQYETLARLADKLSKYSAADLEDYKSKVNADTTSLTELEASLDRYSAAKQQREKSTEERENIVTKLFGGQDLYDEYKKLGQASAELEKKASDKQVQGDGRGANELRDQAAKLRERETQEFTEKLKAFGFNSIAEFQQYLDAYEQAFLKESVAIANDVMDKYEHKLFEAEKYYSQDSAVDALLAQVQSSGAPQLVQQARQKMAEASELSDKGRFQTVQGNAGVGNELSNQAGKKSNEAADLVAQGSKAVKALGAPLIDDEKFPRKELLSNDRATAKSAILAFIAERHTDVRNSRQNLQEDPKIVYKLPKLFALSFDRQNVAACAICERLILDRRGEYVGNEAKWALVLAVIGIALALLIPGGGLLAAGAAIGAATISGYQAIQEYKEYEKKSAFAGVGLADDPSFAWVIVAVVGAVADIGAAVSAVNAIKASGAVKALEATKDLTQFEKDLAAIKELNQAQRTSVLRAAEAQVQSQKAIQALFGASQLSAVPSLTVLALHKAGQLSVVAFYSLKRGVFTFAAWMSELKAARVIADANKLRPEELKALKAAWAEGQELINKEHHQQHPRTGTGDEGIPGSNRDQQGAQRRR